jgi:membrane protein
MNARRPRRLAADAARLFAQHDLLTYSSAIAFQVLYAVVPLTLLGLAGLSLVGEKSIYVRHIAPSLHRRLSSDAFAIANRTALKVMSGERFWWLTLGLVVTLWGLGAALRSMMTPLNAVYGARETRSWRRRLVVSIGGGAIVMTCVIGALIVVIGGRLVHPAGVLIVAFFLLRWLLALALLLTMIAALIRIVPAKKRPLAWISFGSALSTICWIVATLGFGAYISTISYSSFYGGLGSAILLLVYLHVSAIAFLLGVVVDSILRDEVTRSRRGSATGKRRRGRARTRTGT